jgi:ESCRT-II complex subunit VPS25
MSEVSKFPEYYDWPFFFTIQKHAETRIKQLQMWSDLIIQYCIENKVWRLSKSDFSTTLAKNTKINRKLSSEGINLIFEFLVQKNKAMFINAKNNTDEIFILRRSLTEWEEFIYAAATKRQRIETIETLEYITNDEDNESEEFFGMEVELLVLILQRLEKNKKCVLLTDENNKFVGVKFLK